MVLVAITGPAGSGKDTLSKSLAERIGSVYPVQLISGSAVFRSVALWLYEQGYDPHYQLPATTFDTVSLSFKDDEVEIRQMENCTSYQANTYLSTEVGIIGSDFAKNSAVIYKSFVIATIVSQIESNCEKNIHSVIGARDAFYIASQIENAFSLLVYLSVSEKVQRKRLKGRVTIKDEQELEQKIELELERDRQDMSNGTLPANRGNYVSLKRDLAIQSDVIYRLDSNLLSISEATDLLYNAFLKAI
ncbi:(d)CMP kinase [Candidatus Woesearchaeota archaeon]|nr:(d)CMP kinase [Candidatus Woesearchaeota archaeon]